MADTPAEPQAPEMSVTQQKFAGATHLKITTPHNPGYTGVLYGVKFNEGVALVSRTTPNRWGYTLERIAEKFLIEQGGGYQVEGQWLEESQPAKVEETALELPVDVSLEPADERETQAPASSRSAKSTRKTTRKTTTTRKLPEA